MPKKPNTVKNIKTDTAKPFILFSFDGAVMYTEPAILATYRHVFEKLGNGMELQPQNEQEILRSSEKEVFEKYLPETDTMKALQMYNTYQSSHLIDMIQPMHGVRDLLLWLKRKEYTIGIVSARDRNIIVDLLQHTGIFEFFDIIIGTAGHNLQRSDAILKACKLANAQSCIFITDSANNILAGIASGAFTIGIVSHPERTEALSEAGAGFLTKDYHQIKKLIQGEPFWLAYTLLYPEVIERMQMEAQKRQEKEEKKLRQQQKKKKKQNTKTAQK